MRRPDTTEQCVWLGPSRYCGSRRNASTNPICGPYPTNNGDSMRAYSDSNTNCDSYGNSKYDAYTECNSDGHTNTDSTVRNAYANTTKSNTEASAKPAPSTDAVVSTD